MSRAHLLEMLDAHPAFTPEEGEMCIRLREFVAANENCFERSLKMGHITASAWLIDLDRSHALLTHHNKLDKWLQLGGHADGDPDTLRVALREAEEESGLTGIRPVSTAIFDVDIHLIPARGEEPAHYHYDVRFLLEADRGEPLQISNESKDLQWVALLRVADLTNEESVMRMVRKSLSLGSRLL